MIRAAMIIEQICGNIFDSSTEVNDAIARDDLDLEWHECNLRAIRRRSRSGREIAILLPLGVSLRHGDILVAGDAWRVVVNLRPCAVIVVTPRNMQEMAILACELGNLHVPVQATERELIVLNDGPTMGVLRQYNATYEEQTRRFSPMRASVLTRPRLSESFAANRVSR